MTLFHLGPQWRRINPTMLEVRLIISLSERDQRD
jgi:hypothetical protein